MRRGWKRRERERKMGRGRGEGGWGRDSSETTLRGKHRMKITPELARPDGWMNVKAPSGGRKALCVFRFNCFNVEWGAQIPVGTGGGTEVRGALLRVSGSPASQSGQHWHPSLCYQSGSSSHWSSSSCCDSWESESQPAGDMQGTLKGCPECLTCPEVQLDLPQEKNVFSSTSTF